MAQTWQGFAPIDELMPTACRLWVITQTQQRPATEQSRRKWYLSWQDFLDYFYKEEGRKIVFEWFEGHVRKKFLIGVSSLLYNWMVASGQYHVCIRPQGAILVCSRLGWLGSPAAHWHGRHGVCVRRPRQGSQALRALLRHDHQHDLFLYQKWPSHLMYQLIFMYVCCVVFW